MYDLFIIFFAKYAIFLFLIPVIYLWFKGLKTETIKAVFSLALAITISELIKNIYPTDRPESAGAILGRVEGGAFPSSHTAGAFAIATIIFLINRVWGAVFYTLSILIGFARVLGEAHYANDVIAGGVLGFIVGNLVWQMAFYLRKK